MVPLIVMLPVAFVLGVSVIANSEESNNVKTTR